MPSFLDISQPSRTTRKQGLRRGHLNDLNRALAQQMFFWGRDVATRDNLLLKFGFEKLPAIHLPGSSCYRLPWNQGLIELHGACAGWYPEAIDSKIPGFLYIRQHGQSYFHRETEPVVPGRFASARLRSAPLNEHLTASRNFTFWLADYEQWVLSREGRAYRSTCRQLLSNLPAGKPWLPAGQALSWLSRFSMDDPSLPRSGRICG